jgi:hypothetical protein
MTNQEQPRKLRRGDQVKVIACLQQDPRHTGQIGTVTGGWIRNGFIKVSVNNGICQATKVEAVEKQPPAKPIQKSYHYKWNSVRVRSLR